MFLFWITGGPDSTAVGHWTGNRQIASSRAGRAAFYVLIIISSSHLSYHVNVGRDAKAELFFENRWTLLFLVPT